MNEPISDGVVGDFFDPVMADKKPDGSKRVTVNTLGPVTAKFDNIAGIVGETPVTMFVTASEWAKLAKELEAITRAPNPQNFRRLVLRNLTVVNSGSEDQEACNLLNVPEARKCDFQNRRQRLITGRM
jgi:hypothetical protein